MDGNILDKHFKKDMIGFYFDRKSGEYKLGSKISRFPFETCLFFYHFAIFISYQLKVLSP